MLICQVKILSERYQLTISSSSTIENNIKTIYLNDSKKYYRKLDNKTLRLKIPGEERVTAKDILLDALTCEDNWLFTTENIAARWKIPKKRARNKLTLLSNSGYAESRKIVDPKDGKIIMHMWIFFESPQPQKRGNGVNDLNDNNQSTISTKTHSPENGAVLPYIEKEQHEKEQQPPEHDPAVCSVVDFLHSKLKPEYRKSLKKDLIKDAIKKHHRTKPQLEKLIEQINKVPDLKSAGAYFRNVAFNSDNDLPEDQQPVVVDMREKAKKDLAEYEKSIDYEPISVEEMRKIRRENQKKTIPVRCKKELAFKERTNMSFEQKREAFLKKISSDEFLVNRYSYMSDEELKNTNEFNNFSV